MQGGYILFSGLGSDLNHPLCIMAIEQKKKKKKEEELEGAGRKTVPHGGGAYVIRLIVREVLNKKDLRAAESRLFQCGRVGLLLSGEAGQDSAREVCYYLELFWGLF